MFRNYMKIAFRNIKRQKVYSFINISGLAVGLACCIIILLWVQDELNYDRFYINADCLYRVTNEWQKDNQVSKCSLTPVPLASVLKEQFHK